MRPTLSERKLVSLVESGEWEIDSEGRIWRSFLRHGDRWRGVHRLAQCERRRVEHFMPDGYGHVRAMVDGRRLVCTAHRLVWQRLHGDIEPGLVINHKNGVKGDNRPSNLELVTPSENTRHAYRIGLKDEHGMLNPAARLTDHQIAVIRNAYASGGFTQAELAARYGCTHQHVSKLVRGARRPRQGGPIEPSDHRHASCIRDDRGRFATEAPDAR